MSSIIPLYCAYSLFPMYKNYRHARMKIMSELIPIQIIENKIFVIRGHKVMIDRDLAELYGVRTKALNQAVKRNIERFPEEFMFKLNDNEKKELVTNCDRFKTLVHSTSDPYAFTEHGVAMLSSVLNSKQAIFINIGIIKAFIKLREMAIAHRDLATQLNELEIRFIEYAKENTLEQQEQNQKINEIFQCLQYLVDIHKPSKVGFTG